MALVAVAVAVLCPATPRGAAAALTAASAAHVASTLLAVVGRWSDDPPVLCLHALGRALQSGAALAGGGDELRRATATAWRWLAHDAPPGDACVAVDGCEAMAVAVLAAALLLLLLLLLCCCCASRAKERSAAAPARRAAATTRPPSSPLPQQRAGAGTGVGRDAARGDDAGDDDAAAKGTSGAPASDDALLRLPSDFNPLIHTVPVPEEPAALARASDALVRKLDWLWREDYVRCGNALLRAATDAARRALQAAPPPDGDHAAAIRAMLERLEGGRYDLARRVHEELGVLVHEVSAAEAWTPVDDADGIRTFYRSDPPPAGHEGESDRQSLYVVGDVDAPLFSIVSALFELDLMRTWLPGVEFSGKLATMSRFQTVGALEFGLPWPVSNREAVFYGYGDVVDVEGELACAVFIRSVGERELRALAAASGQAVRYPQLSAGNVRVDIERGGFLVSPLPDGQVRVRGVFRFDPKVSLPAWLINYVRAAPRCTRRPRMRGSHEGWRAPRCVRGRSPASLHSTSSCVRHRPPHAARAALTRRRRTRMRRCTSAPWPRSCRGPPSRSASTATPTCTRRCGRAFAAWASTRTRARALRARRAVGSEGASGALRRRRADPFGAALNSASHHARCGL